MHLFPKSRNGLSPVVSCIIFFVCSSWMHFYSSLIRAKDILESNQYPTSFYEPLISATIEKLLAVAKPNDQETGNDEKSPTCNFFNIEGNSRMTL